jgi:peptide deformylase
MRLKIVQVGDPVLRAAASPLAPSEIASAEIQNLLGLMRETMRDAPGVGLAAPQVGIGLQLAVIEDRAEYHKDIPPELLADRERMPVPFHVTINPRLTLLGDETVESFEGCLSLPGFSAIVPRARRVRVDCLDEHAQPKVIEASGWYARILQHEIDHLGGTIYIDRMRSRTFATFDNLNRHWKGKPVSDVLSETDARS